MCHSFPNDPTFMKKQQPKNKERIKQGKDISMNTIQNHLTDFEIVIFFAIGNYLQL